MVILLEAHVDSSILKEKPQMLFEAMLEEVRKKLLDDKLKMAMRSRKVRRKMLEKCGPQAFLKSNDTYPKFPVMTPKCKYHCGLILAAYLRARSWHYEDIAQKAIKLYQKLGCDKKIGIIIRQTERKNWAPRVSKPKQRSTRLVKRPKIRRKHEFYRV